MTKRRLHPYQADSFYGVAVQENWVPGLVCKLRHGKRKEQVYSYLVFLADGKIKWKIVPTITHNGKVQSLHILHHIGRRPHSQTQSAWATPKGLRELIDYITKHEAWEHG